MKLDSTSYWHTTLQDSLPTRSTMHLAHPPSHTPFTPSNPLQPLPFTHTLTPPFKPTLTPPSTHTLYPPPPHTHTHTHHHHPHQHTHTHTHTHHPHINRSTRLREMDSTSGAGARILLWRGGEATRGYPGLRQMDLFQRTSSRCPNAP